MPIGRLSESPTCPICPSGPTAARGTSEADCTQHLENVLVAQLSEAKICGQVSQSFSILSIILLCWHSAKYTIQAVNMGHPSSGKHNFPSERHLRGLFSLASAGNASCKIVAMSDVNILPQSVVSTHIDESQGGSSDGLVSTHIDESQGGSSDGLVWSYRKRMVGLRHKQA